jgi:hypothetical protein
LDLNEVGWGGMDWTGWLNTGTDGGLLWTRWWTFVFFLKCVNFLNSWGTVN